MYGMVNKAVEDMVVSRHGEDTWRLIKAKAGVDTEVFIGNEGYPDSITYSLVGAASEVLALPAETILRAFGEHWVLETAQKGYGPMMRAAGSTLGEFLAYLPHFHDRVALIYPKLEPPHFAVSERTANSLVLHYHSHRPGLTPFVEGLIEGLAKMFATPAAVALVKSRDKGDDHDAFRISW
ncbi:MAG: hypothetical protein RLZZ50_93 [Verrucomicrobiota bacterium]